MSRHRKIFLPKVSAAFIDNLNHPFTWTIVYIHSIKMLLDVEVSTPACLLSSMSYGMSSINSLRATKSFITKPSTRGASEAILVSILINITCWPKVIFLQCNYFADVPSKKGITFLQSSKLLVPIIWIFSSLIFGLVTKDRQKAMHMSPPCISTGVLNKACLFPPIRVGINIFSSRLFLFFARWVVRKNISPGHK